MTPEQTTILDQAQQIAELRAKLANAAAYAQILADARTSNTLAAERIKELEAQLAQREDTALAVRLEREACALLVLKYPSPPISPEYVRSYFANLIRARGEQPPKVGADASNTHILTPEQYEREINATEDIDVAAIMRNAGVKQADPPKMGTCPVCRLGCLLKPNGGTGYHSAYNPLTRKREQYKCPGAGDIPMEARTGLDYSCRDEQWKPGE